MDRRTFCKRSVGKLLLAISTISHFACNSNSTDTSADIQTSVGPCSDLTGVSQADLEARKGLGYVEQSPIDHQLCNNCKHWLPPEDESPCGNCLLFKGPVYPQGYCTYWETKDVH